MGKRNKSMLAYKGFRKGLICRGYQYFENQWNCTDKARCHERGFHCAENPLDCLVYYPSWESSEYYLVEAKGDLDEDAVDSKIACTELFLKRKLELVQLLYEGLKYMIKKPGRNWSSVVSAEKGKGHLLGKLRIDHAQLLRLRKAESIKRLEWLQYEKETGKQIDDHLISWYIEQGLSPASISFIKGRMSALQIKNYLSRQSAENGEKIGNVLSIWMDYLRMADSLGWDTQDAIIYRARKLFERHDEASQCLRRKKLQERISEKKTAFPTIQQICSSIRKKYEYRSDKEVYEILVPNGIEDILAEGECLKHCIDVNNLYLQRIADRETYILFLRKKENPMQPYFTLEVEPNGTVRQKSTYYNRQEKNMDEINQFLKRWQRVIQKRLSKQDKLWTEESQRKREEEYLQLRKEKKIIFAGNYNGRLLADILEENLLETEAEPAA